MHRRILHRMASGAAVRAFSFNIYRLQTLALSRTSTSTSPSPSAAAVQIRGAMVRVASWRDGGVVRVGSAPPGRLPLRHASPHARPRRADRAASRHPAEPLDALGCSSPPRSAVEPPCRCSSGALSNRDWLPRPLRARRSRRVPSHHCGAEPLSLFDWCTRLPGPLHRERCWERWPVVPS